MAKHDNPLSATFTAVKDVVFRKKTRGPDDIPVLGDDERLDGKAVLVTGSNSGLGKAVAIQMAQRGANVLMACRSGVPAAGEEVMRISGSDNVEMLRVDLSDLDEIETFCDQLRDRDITLDVAVFNAGLMPRNAKRNKHGLELMFAVNYLAKFVTLSRLLADGVIENHAFSDRGQGTTAAASRGDDVARVCPRIIFVSSEAHRSARAFDPDTVGQYEEYGMTGGMAHYGYSKLLLNTFAAELSRRLNPDGTVDVSVCSLCPGPVNSNMARDAPFWVKPILKPVMRFLFRSPEAAAEPVMYLAAARELEGVTGQYLHMLKRKSAREDTLDPDQGKTLWDATEALLEAL